MNITCGNNSKIEAENDDPMNINQQLNHQREQLLNQIINKQSSIQDDIITLLTRRGSNTSLSSNMNKISGNDVENEMELGMSTDDKLYIKMHGHSHCLSDGQYYVSSHDMDDTITDTNTPQPQLHVSLTQTNIQANKQDIQLNNIINENKNKLMKICTQKQELTAQLEQLKQNQARSDQMMVMTDILLMKKKKKLKNYIYDVEHDVIQSNNDFDNERIIIKNESDGSYDSEFIVPFYDENNNICMERDIFKCGGAFNVMEMNLLLSINDKYFECVGAAPIPPINKYIVVMFLKCFMDLFCWIQCVIIIGSFKYLYGQTNDKYGGVSGDQYILFMV